MKQTNYIRKPSIALKGNPVIWTEWEIIIERLNKSIHSFTESQKIVAVETYQGVIHEEVEVKLKDGLSHDVWINSKKCFKPEETIRGMVYPDVTDDRVFGYLTRLTMEDFMDHRAIQGLRDEITEQPGTTVIYGPGASLLVEEFNMLIYFDMARWEIQQRQRRHEVDNLGLSNRETEDWMLLYKQGFFVDWRVCDRLKKQLFDKWDFVLDTNIQGQPKMVEGKTVLQAMDQAVYRPFSVVPFFDPGPWGGQWMKEKCNLDPSAANYAWCFNCVPEENSMYLKIREHLFEIPSINLVFKHPVELLGDPVHARFGDEFPIRFDFLDTMDGGNLSLQVHPLTEYIQEKFGMHYTQDESYYLMDAKEDAVVYLGLKEGVNPYEMMDELEKSKETGEFNAEKHVQTWPVKKHDHLLIPGGTVHCSGNNSMVLEISATPYIFTFKLWDWGRVGLDGKPRPINIEHGKKVIQWNRTTNWTKNNLVNRIQTIDEGDGWKEEHTGLHEREFIETRRHWFTKKTKHHTNNGVNVLCLVEGNEVLIESPANSFEPFHVHYAEVFIVPATVGEYTITPAKDGEKCATVKAYVRY